MRATALIEEEEHRRQGALGQHYVPELRRQHLRQSLTGLGDSVLPIGTGLEPDAPPATHPSPAPVCDAPAPVPREQEAPLGQDVILGTTPQASRVDADLTPQHVPDSSLPASEPIAAPAPPEGRPDPDDAVVVLHAALLRWDDDETRLRREAESASAACSAAWQRYLAAARTTGTSVKLDSLDLGSGRVRAVLAPLYADPAAAALAWETLARREGGQRAAEVLATEPQTLGELQRPARTRWARWLGQAEPAPDPLAVRPAARVLLGIWEARSAVERATQAEAEAIAAHRAVRDAHPGAGIQALDRGDWSRLKALLGERRELLRWAAGWRAPSEADRRPPPLGPSSGLGR
jgi:hypothetical protein